MSWRRRFVSQQLPQFWAQQLGQGWGRPQLTDFESGESLFDLCWELGWLGAESGVGEELMRVRLEGGDEEVGGRVRQLQFVHRLMLQLQLRLLRLFWASGESGSEGGAVGRLVDQIVEIYPVAKAEISIGHPSISLHKFIHKYLNQLQSHRVSPSFIDCLHSIKDRCNMIGPTEHTINQFIETARLGQRHPVHEQNHSKAEASKAIKQSSAVEAQGLKESTGKGVIHEASLFRGKKKRPAPAPGQGPLTSNTPTRKTKPKHKHTPATQPSLPSAPPTPLFKKIRKARQAPANRTLYFGSSKAFQSKAPSLQTFSLPAGEPTACSLPSFPPSQSTSRLSKQDGDNTCDGSGFEVEETPRPVPRVLLSRTASMDGMRA